MNIDLPFVVYGTPPDAGGRRCDGLWVRQFWFEGILTESANGVFFKIGGRWDHLCFDVETVHWRAGSAGPTELREDGGRLVYRPVDLTTRIGGPGVVMTDVLTDAGPVSGPRVRMRFASGKTATFWHDDAADRSHYEIS